MKHQMNEISVCTCSLEDLHTIAHSALSVICIVSTNMCIIIIIIILNEDLVN